MKDLIIIGAGPAGLSAAIYGIRAGLDLAVLERFSPGGQVMNTYEVENYPGFTEPVKGYELVEAMEGQAKRLGAEILSGDAESITKAGKNGNFRTELTDKRVLESKAVIIASGASFNKLRVPGEEKFTGKGVSYCATCDAAFFRNKITAVIGGGDVALEEADFLTRFAKKVYLIHRRKAFRGAKILQDRIFANSKIEPIYDTIVKEIGGEEKVTSIKLQDAESCGERILEVDGVFIFIGYASNSAFLPREILNKNNEVIVDNNMQTIIPGLYAAGDIRENSKKQIVMAAADGATAALNVYDYLLETGNN